jgi:N-acetylmuramoyl-L-alanine amidase
MSNDSDVLARTLYGESRGELYGGKVAVANAIMHRVHTDLFNDNKPDWWGEDIIGVCQKPGQFSCWNANDPNRAKIEAVTVADPAFLECVEIAERAVMGLLPDLVFGSTHYHTTAVRPVWSRGHRPVIQIGTHLFFNTIG